MTLTEYEIQRNARMAEVAARRKEIIKDFDLFEPKTASRSEPKRKPPRPSPVSQDGPARRSARIESSDKPRPNYDEGQAFRAFEPRRGSGGSSRADKRLVFSDTYAADGDRAESIWEGLPIACRDAAYEANRAATAFAATLPGHTCVIPMTQSKTRKGFWCSAPKEWGLAAHGVLEDKSKTHMTLETDGLAWPVVLLGRPGEALGFSGGWRGYAIDQRLWPNDSVVVNYRDSRQEGAARLAAGRPLRHYCYIFRAWDYDDKRPDNVPHSGGPSGGDPSPALPGADDFYYAGGRAEGRDEYNQRTAAAASEAASYDVGTSSSQQPSAAVQSARKAEPAAPSPQRSKPQKKEAEEGGERRFAHEAARAPPAPPGSTDANVQRKQELAAASDGDAAKAAPRATAQPSASAGKRAPAGGAAAADDKRASKRKAPNPPPAEGLDEPNNHSSRNTSGTRGQRKAPRHEPGPAKYDEDGNELYDVDWILGAQKAEDGTVLYRIRWQRYGKDADSWEPADCLSADPLKDYDWKGQPPEWLVAELRARPSAAKRSRRQ